MLCTNSDCGCEVEELSRDEEKVIVDCPRCGVYGVAKK